MQQSTHDKVLSYVAKHQGTISPQIVRDLGASTPVVNRCIKIMVDSGRLTQIRRGKTRLLYTTEYIVENGVPVVAKTYSRKASLEERPTPTIDGQIMFNRLYFNKGLAAL